MPENVSEIRNDSNCIAIVRMKRTQIILKPRHSKAHAGIWPTAESSLVLARRMQSKAYRKKFVRNGSKTVGKTDNAIDEATCNASTTFSREAPP